MTALTGLFLAFAGGPTAHIDVARAQIPCPAPPESPPAREQGLPPVGPHGPADVCYPAGWNLVGGPAVFPVPLWVWDPASAQYQEIPAGAQPAAGPEGESDGGGAWAYFPEFADLTFNGVFPTSTPVPVTLAAGIWQQVANPFDLFTATVCGAPEAFTYDPASGTYIPNPSTLEVGQGAWVYSPAPTTITLIPAGIGASRPPP